MTYYLIVLPGNKWLGIDYDSGGYPWASDVPKHAKFFTTKEEAVMYLAGLRGTERDYLKADQAVIRPVTFPTG